MLYICLKHKLKKSFFIIEFETKFCFERYLKRVLEAYGWKTWGGGAAGAIYEICDHGRLAGGAKTHILLENILNYENEFLKVKAENSKKNVKFMDLATWPLRMSWDMEEYGEVGADGCGRSWEDIMMNQQHTEKSDTVIKSLKVIL